MRKRNPGDLHPGFSLAFTVKNEHSFYKIES